MTQRAYLVIPFQRNGVTLGPSQAYLFDAVAPAQIVARQLAPRVAGVAILERQTDPETGDDMDKVIAEIGAIPPAFPERADWSMRLN